ncbi:hypothetical protein PsorP6_009645 [Peronosclerospora sorghi]|uniref:Uncharacterized protein n=1 Tax=Peronosclerospora sorghi TaxID=230839 RepID=A0ACC0VYB6_9STRA|nr:hypothetical protein PsorP6_009645 [Peronosclerospora sorghi]
MTLSGRFLLRFVLTQVHGFGTHIRGTEIPLGVERHLERLLQGLGSESEQFRTFWPFSQASHEDRDGHIVRMRFLVHPCQQDLKLLDINLQVLSALTAPQERHLILENQIRRCVHVHELLLKDLPCWKHVRD